MIALEDVNALTVEDFDQEERRFKTLGMSPILDVLLIVHCERSANRIRIISARKANRQEIAQYFNGLSI